MKSAAIPQVVFAVAASVLLMPMSAPAQSRSDVYNGGTCVPAGSLVPPLSLLSADQGWAGFWWHQLFVGSEYDDEVSAWCHIMMPGDWSTSQLSYVLFSGASDSEFRLVRVRLCVYWGSSITCGTERTISRTSGTYGWFSSPFVNWVVLPSPMPSYASGAFLYVSFPRGRSTLQQFIAVWIPPPPPATPIFLRPTKPLRP